MTLLIDARAPKWLNLISFDPATWIPTSEIMLIEPTLRTEIYLLLCKGSTGTNVSNALQIYTVKLQWKLDTCKKCTLYKYLICYVQSNV